MRTLLRAAERGDFLGGIQSSIELNDRMSSVLLGIINAVNSTVSAVERMNSSLSANVDMSGLQAANQQILNVERELNNLSGMQVQMPEWQSYDGIEIFNTSGAERYAQEINSVNQMMTALRLNQEAITNNAVYGNVLPPSAANDMINLNNRIQRISESIQRISSRPIDAVAPQELNQLEQLRAQMSEALRLQREIDDAVNDMDVARANAAYLRLSQTVSNTERAIRDNVSEQQDFNNSVQNGNSAFDGLISKVKSLAGAYLGIQGVQKVVDMSDELVSAQARLDMMSNGNGAELYDKVYAAAERARGSIGSMADVVARFGNNAADAFTFNGEFNADEVVLFSELIQKQMTIAGASTQEASNAMLQLSQALGSGVLRGDELNSIFEQAPNLIQGIADYLGVSIGQIRQMAQDGKLTADVVRNSVFAQADEINAKFAAMPKTWSQIWQSMKNQAAIALQPVLTRLSEMFNSEKFQASISGAMDLFAKFADIALDALEALGSVAGWVSDNWSTIEPILMGLFTAMLAYKSATVLANGAQKLLNGSLGNFKSLGVTAVAAGFGIAMGIVKDAVNDAYGTSYTYTEFMNGTMMAVFVALGDTVLGIAKAFMVLGVVALGAGKNIGAALENFGHYLGEEVPIDDQINQLQSGIDYYYRKAEEEAAKKGDGVKPIIDEYTQAKIDKAYEEIAKLETEKGNIDYADFADIAEVVSDTWEHGITDFLSPGEAFDWASNNKVNMGPYKGDDSDTNADSYDELMKKIQAEIENTQGLLDGIGEDTSDIKDGLDITAEELEYLRDIAEKDTINRFTTAEVKIEQTNNNQISSDMDIDGVVSHLTDMAQEAMQTIAEGVHE